MKRLAIFGLLFFTSTLFAETCSKTCGGATCTATGESVSCYCHWFTSSPCCGTNSESMEKLNPEERFSLEVNDVASFADRGGDLVALLESDLFDFYNRVIRAFGYNENVHQLLRNLEEVKGYYESNNGELLKLSLEKLEHTVDPFSNRNKIILADLALEHVYGDQQFDIEEKSVGGKQ